MNTQQDTPRYRADDLMHFASSLYVAAGVEQDMASIIARYLVEADLLGHTTHGLQLCVPYLDQIDQGAMAVQGEPAVINTRGGVQAWDGRRLPGVWLTAKAVDAAVAGAEAFGIGAVSIRESHHIGCLAAFLQRATDRGMMVIITCSDPATASVAPFGGLDAVMTPNPMAVGIPTDGDPVLIDISASITTNGLSGRLHAEGRRLPGVWALDHDGTPTDDPGVIFADPPGTLLPVGGTDHGHKGYALGLTVEALSQALSGHGRADAPTGWGASVYVQVSDPEAFGGAGAFTRQTRWLVDRCHDVRPAPGVTGVRLPGERGLALRRAALRDGVALYPGIMEALAARAQAAGVSTPDPL